MTELTKKEHTYFAHGLQMLLNYNFTGSQHQQLVDLRWDKKFLEMCCILRELDRTDYDGLKGQ